MVMKKFNGEIFGLSVLMVGILAVASFFAEWSQEEGTPSPDFFQNLSKSILHNSFPNSYIILGIYIRKIYYYIFFWRTIY
jgi:hypothetical protein